MFFSKKPPGFGSKQMPLTAPVNPLPGLAIVAAIARSFSKANFEYPKAACRTNLRRHRHGFTLALLQGSQLFSDPVKSPYLLLSQNRSFEAKNGSRIPWSPRRQNALHLSLGNMHLGMKFPYEIGGLHDRHAVFFASRARLIVCARSYRGSHETPPLDRVLLLSGPSPLSTVLMHRCTVHTEVPERVANWVGWSPSAHKRPAMALRAQESRKVWIERAEWKIKASAFPD